MRTLSHRDAVLVLYAVALSFGVAAVMMSMLPSLYALAVIGCACVLTGLGLNRLKYLRRSYVEPDVHPIGRAGRPELGENSPSPNRVLEFRGLVISDAERKGEVGEPTPDDSEVESDRHRATPDALRGSPVYGVAQATS
jgi:hypothetical protein